MAGESARLPDMGDITRKIPGYRIERELGRGSMGVVYLAEDIQLRRKVALKILTPTLVDDELFRKRFDRESQSAANLDHPSIVPVYAAGEAGGSLYIAMRYVGGGDLRALIEANGPLSLEQTTSIIATVADALDAAHDQGMIHRDVKPANILIDGRNGQEHYYLSDFGITKIISSDRSLTSTGQIVGTVDYIAPEQIQGKPVDGRADLYALGCVLYQCLTGVVPFPREEAAALMWAHVHDAPPSVTAHRPDLPSQIDRIVSTAMAKQPEDRFATCRALALALRAVAAGSAASEESGKALPVPAVDGPPPPIASSMTSTYTPPAPAPTRVPAAAAPSRRKRWWLAAGGVLILALIAGATPIVRNYVDSRFPNEAEQALLDQMVPLSLIRKNSCNRNAEAAEDPTNVQASVTCTSDGDEPNTVVYTRFTSFEALDNHYRSAVAAGVPGESSDDCTMAAQAKGTYMSKSGQMSGRTVCYQSLGSSFIVWTDEKSNVLGQATRVDTHYVKIRNWWANLMGLPTMTESEEQAKTRKQVEDAEKKAEDARKQAEEEKKLQQAAADKKVEDARRQNEDARKQAEEEKKLQQAAADKKVEDAEKKVEDARKQAEEEKKLQQAAADKKAAEEARRRDAEDRRRQDQEDRRQGQNGAGQGQNGTTMQGQDDTGAGAGGQDLQQLIDDAVSRAIQQRGNTGDQSIEQQIKEDVKRSIQQRRTDSDGLDIQQLVDDAMKQAIEQSAGTPGR